MGYFGSALRRERVLMFDEIYWIFLHERYFGCIDSIENMTVLLSQEEQDDMAEFVQTKLQQAEEETLDEHLTFDQIFEL